MEPIEAPAAGPRRDFEAEIKAVEDEYNAEIEKTNKTIKRYTTQTQNSKDKNNLYKANLEKAIVAGEDLKKKIKKMKDGVLKDGELKNLTIIEKSLPRISKNIEDQTKIVNKNKEILNSWIYKKNDLITERDEKIKKIKADRKAKAAGDTAATTISRVVRKKIKEKAEAKEEGDLAETKGEGKKGKGRKIMSQKKGGIKIKGKKYYLL
jgi:hypothetical protein